MKYGIDEPWLLPNATAQVFLFLLLIGCCVGIFRSDRYSMAAREFLGLAAIVWGFGFFYFSGEGLRKRVEHPFDYFVPNICSYFVERVRTNHSCEPNFTYLFVLNEQ